MQRWYSFLLPRSARSLVWLAILTVFVISLLALIGWFLDIVPLMSVRPQWIRMSSITATCLILAGLQLVLLQVNPYSLRRFKVLQTPALLVSLVGLLTVTLYCFALVTGRDSSFGFAPFLNLFWAPETRLALLTAINFLLSGIALALLANGSRRAANIAHILILPGALTSYLVLISYLLGVQAWYGWLDVPMALNTGLAFIALYVAIFCVRPDTWLMSVLTSAQTGGIMARRLLPALLMIPFLIGWLRIYGERAGIFASEVGVALVAVAYTFCLLSLVLLTAASLNRADLKHRQAEGARLESDMRFKAFMDNSPAIAWAKDEAGRYVYLSKACEDRFNIRLENCRDKTDFDLWPQAVAEKFRQNDLEVLARGQTIEVIEENIDLDGSRCYWWNFKFPFSGAAGERYVGGVGVDITKFKQAEKALQESREDLNRAQSVAKTGSWRLDVQSSKLDWSDETYRIFRIPPGTMLTYEAFLSLVHPEDQEYVNQEWTAALLGKPYDIEHRILVGEEVKWVCEKTELEFDQEGKLLGGFGTVQDITDRKRAEEALRQSEAGLAEAQRMAHLGNWELDISRNEVTCSDEVYRIFGLAPQEFRPTLEDFRSFIHPDDLLAVNHQLEKGIRSGKYGPYNYRIVRRDGSTRYIFALGETYYNQENQPLRMLGTLQDITELKQAEAALQESEERFRLAFENANIGMAIVGIDGRYLRVNDALSEMFGYHREELEKMGVRDLTYPDDLQVSRDFRLQTLRGEIANAQFEKRNVHRNGTILWVQIASSLVRDSQDKPLYFISQVQDITARKKAEEELRRVLDRLEQRIQERTEELRQTVAQLQQEVTERQRAEEAILESEAKLRSLTQRVLALQEKERQQLSWELQEDLAQYITALKLELQTFEPKLPAGDEKLRQDYRQALNKINVIVENLRRRAMDLSPQMLADLGLTVALKSMFENFGRIHDLECDLHLDELNQFFNAADQISVYRVLEEALENIVQHAAATKVTLAAKSKDDEVEFLVEDNGQGFDPAIAEARQGVGLSAMAERVRALGGTFKLESQIAVGTKILFTIPRTGK